VLGGGFIILILIKYVGKDFGLQTKEHMIVTYSSLIMYSILMGVSLVLLSGVFLTPDGWAIFLIMFYIMRTPLNAYCIMCVWSQYCELKAGRGTFLYHQKRKRHNRNMVRQIQPISQPDSSQHTSLPTVSAYCEATRVSYNEHGEVILAPPPYKLDPPSYSQINLNNGVNDDSTDRHKDNTPLVTSSNVMSNTVSIAMSFTSLNLMSTTPSNM
ncbi:unnamed protein product, partial [Owenia fusiformis]